MPFHHRANPVTRRGFLAASGSALAAGPLLPAAEPVAAAAATSAESLAARLHASLSPAQREKVCFPWDYVHPKFGLLRTRVANNWNATEPQIAGSFFTPDQQRLVRDIFEQLVRPEWHARFDKQMEDDCGGFGHSQSLALLGEPGSGKFQFLLTGRHMTLRCDGDSADHVAFAGPIFYGHDTGTFEEPADHAGNVFWSQALAANALAGMLDGRQREAALLAKSPAENAVGFKGDGSIPGLPVSELSADQRAEMERVLGLLLEPFRQADQIEARSCLTAQGGLDRCRLAFFRDADIGNDGIWDNWKLEGPSFVWYYRGAPHVHVWVNIADTPTVTTNA
ncbi:MAG: DUF3500 domain-containing protein [Planctomycetota bacterium]|nr:MAG: DUF3500 domain-containing protein [Planctomycetota bacterium]